MGTLCRRAASRVASGRDCAWNIHAPSLRRYSVVVVVYIALRLNKVMEINKKKKMMDHNGELKSQKVTLSVMQKKNVLTSQDLAESFLS